MEALIIIFAELATALITPVIVLVVDLVGALIAAIASLFGVTVSSAGSSPPWLKRGVRTVMYLLFGVAAAVVMGMAIANQFFFSDVVRYVFDQTEQRSGIAAECDNIDGSLFAGRVNVEDCRLQRSGHPTNNFDLKADRLTVDLQLTSILGNVRFEEAAVAGLEGRVSTLRPASDQRERDETERPRRHFIIDRLELTDTRLNLSGSNKDGNRFQFPVEANSVVIEPLRSRYALFDVLFRSNSTGAIAGAPFRITSSEIADGRRTSWQADDIPVAQLGSITGGLLAWFKSGSVNVDVEDEWQIDDNVSIDMDWQLDFEGVEIEAPEGTGKLARVAAAPLTRFVNGLDGDFPLRFGMVVNESQFEFQSSLVASALWDAIGESVNRVLEKLGIKLEDAAETGRELKEGAKSILDRLRRTDNNEG